MISATTTSAHSAAARVQSILAPSVQKPCSSTSESNGWGTGRGQLKKTHIEMIASAAEELGDFSEEDRNVVVLTAVDGLSRVSTHKQVASVENTVKLYTLIKEN